MKMMCKLRPLVNIEHDSLQESGQIACRELVYIPDWSNTNPYQKLLYSAVGRLGRKCRGMCGKDFSFKWILHNRKKVKFIHLHWLYAIYDPDNTGLNYNKALSFCLKVLLAKALGYTIFWTVHNFMSHESTNVKIESRVRKFTASMADAVLVHCVYAKNKIIHKWKTKEEKIKVMPHGSYLGHYPNSVTRREARGKIGIPNDSFTFLFFGMIRNYKGVRVLVESFREVEERNPKVRLIIAGQPMNEIIKQETEEMADNERIKCFLKFIPDEEIQYYFNAVDVVVLPYQNILTSGAAILALTYGKRVIAPKKGCLPELISEEVGFLYTTDDELKEAMYSASRKSNCDEINQKALEIAESINWNRIVVERYLPMISEDN